MANEISTSTNFTFQKNGNPPQAWTANGTITVSGNYFVSGVQNIGTTDETVSLGDIGTVGWVLLKNLDGTNYVTAGSDGSVYPIKLKAGEEIKTRWNGAAVHLKANTAACNVAYLIVED